MSDPHTILKNKTALMLENRGFSVKIEKRIYTPEEIAPIRDYQPAFIDGEPDRLIKQQFFAVDVYGERDGEILIYEVGNCDREKLNWLREHIGKVIHLPYLTKWLPTMYESQRPKKQLLTQDQIDGLTTPNITGRKW